MATYEEEKDRQSKKDYAYQYYLNKGYRPIEAAAIVGNLDIESGGFRDDVIAGTNKNKDNGSEGVAQWRLDRLTKLKSRYKNYKSLDNQLDFIDWELKNTHTDALKSMKKANSVEEATHAFTFKYEKPSSNPKLNHFDKRLKSAASIAGVELDPNFSYNSDSEVLTKVGYEVDRSSYIEPTPLSNIETSTEEYIEPKEVVEAKSQIAENGFIDEFKTILENQQQQINNLQQIPQQEAEQGQQQDFVPDDMQDPYNYIQIQPEFNFEEFKQGGIF